MTNPIYFVQLLIFVAQLFHQITYWYFLLCWFDESIMNYIILIRRKRKLNYAHYNYMSSIKSMFISSFP